MTGPMRSHGGGSGSTLHQARVRPSDGAAPSAPSFTRRRHEARQKNLTYLTDLLQRRILLPCADFVGSAVHSTGICQSVATNGACSPSPPTHQAKAIELHPPTRR